MNEFYVNKFNLDLAVDFRSWVEYKNQKYKVGSVIEVGFSDDTSFKILAKIKCVIVFPNTLVKFIIKKFECCYFDAHIQAFAVIKTNNISLINFNECNIYSCHKIKRILMFASL